MSQPTIAVIIPNYNRTVELKRALASVAAQSRQPDEVIVIDDCSLPHSRGEIDIIIRTFSAVLPLRMVVNGTNKGANYSRNRGIFEASSEYLAFLDSDDLWMPTKLEVQLRHIRQVKSSNKAPVLSTTGRYRINSIGDILACQFGATSYSSCRIRETNFIGTLSSAVVETCAARAIGGFDEKLAASQDWDFFIRLSSLVQYAGVAAPLCIYFEHDGERISSNSRNRIKSHLVIRRRHIAKVGKRTITPKGFYRSLAEDMQAIGGGANVLKFYSRYVYLGRNKGLRLLLPECLFLAFFYLRGVPNLKEARYRKYRDNLTAYCASTQRWADIRRDLRTIKLMVGAS